MAMYAMSFIFLLMEGAVKTLPFAHKPLITLKVLQLHVGISASRRIGCQIKFLNVGEMLKNFQTIRIMIRKQAPLNFDIQLITTGHFKHLGRGDQMLRVLFFL